MRAVFGLVLIVGVALAGGAVMMAKNYIAAYQTELARERQARAAVVPTVDVFVATRALRYGESLTEDAVRAVKWPQNAIPEGAFTDRAALFPPELTDRRYILRSMEKDEAIMAMKVTAPGEDAGITSRLERGMRAFAIRVDVSSGVSGFLRPGDRVDVYWTGSLRGTGAGSNGDVTRLIQANIKLIAIDQSASEDIDSGTIARTVTVSARPEEVAALAQAQSTGRLSLSLVGAEDDTIASAVEVDQRSLLGLGAIEAAPEKVEERVCTIRTRRGAEVVEIPIPCTN
ncbi:Flp pilus assembly protein CpaB [Arenibacterium halophilum]|uniref:Flp pilus assembly protein CpaB n=1 Tax=Arenibacterium halophilum TaxID=2583821 RepID=A0ABY2XDN9_9RHOB|nr:Flp pilus assembly protein CpaB [Arenibacterium halophilum]MEC7257554.1 Flp pilus assembly protein CpaB [Pseudomonadota bacterium]TMV15142.1 Flp pilus assembly protein CpaB [Arenibacterium halophilum]